MNFWQTYVFTKFNHIAFLDKKPKNLLLTPPRSTGFRNVLSKQEYGQKVSTGAGENCIKHIILKNLVLTNIFYIRFRRPYPLVDLYFQVKIDKKLSSSHMIFQTRNFKIHVEIRCIVQKCILTWKLVFVPSWQLEHVRR